MPADRSAFWGEELTKTRLDALAFLDPIPQELEGEITQAIQAEMVAMSGEKDADGNSLLRDYKAFVDEKLALIPGYTEALEAEHQPSGTANAISSELSFHIHMSEDTKQSLDDARIKQARLRHEIEKMTTLLGEETKEIALKTTFQANISEGKAINEKLASLKRTLDNQIEEVSKKRKLFQLQGVGDLKNAQETLVHLRSSRFDV